MLISTLENLLNRGLPRSPRARQLCAELSGRKVAVEARGLMRVVVTSVGDSLSVSRGLGATVNQSAPASADAAAAATGQAGAAMNQSVSGNGDAPGAERAGQAGTAAPIGEAPSVVDAEIIGAPLALLQLAGAEPEAAIQRGDVLIRGDGDVAQKFRELALLLRPDIEEELALIIGDTPAHQLGRFARAAFGWSRRAAETTVRNVSEFLAHERGDLVSRPEGNQFLKGVDAVREDADRLEARLELIRQRAEALLTQRRGA